VRRYVGYTLEGAGLPLHRVERDVPAPGPEQALVRVAGCGVCHTDAGFLEAGVRTRHPLPLVLGHEISGYVEDAGRAFRPLVGQAVVVPAVLPCGVCAECRGGRATTCAAQVMPGNDCDGGFASHVVVPARFLCPVPGATEDADAPLSGRTTLRHLAVVADAVSTAYQSVHRSGLAAGDLAIVVGLGGVGGYAAQIARDRGAMVVAIDVDPTRLAQARGNGAEQAIDPSGLPIKEVRSRIQAAVRENGAAAAGWKIFECSGTPAGQATAFGLLGPAATLMVVGFTLETITVRLSNLMAFDAKAVGNWGCDPGHYPEIVRMVLEGRIDVASSTEMRPLSSITRVFEDLRNHRISGRVVLVPDAEARA
jgi:6-hydroxycyclohex-1-ene-1-carbonyl-CoA dehydrogenase